LLVSIPPKRIAAVPQTHSGASPVGRATSLHKAEARAWAAALGLVAEFPDFPSWWFPGATVLCVFTRAPAIESFSLCA
jgi:hypothetical protein